MLGLAGVLALVAAAAEVSVTVTPGTPCVSQSPLSRKLRGGGLNVVETPGASTLRVTLRGEGRQVLVLARRGALAFERRVPASLDDCAAITRVTVALISAWAATPASDTIDGGIRESADQRDGGARESTTRLGVSGPSEVPRVIADGGASPVSDSSARQPVGESAVSPTGDSMRLPTLGPSEDLHAGEDGEIVRDSGAPPRGSSSPRLSDDPTKPSPQPSPPRGEGDTFMSDGGTAPLHFEVAVLGGISAGPTRDLTGSGAVLAGASLGRWGLLLEAGFESERAAFLDPVRVSAAIQWLSVSFRVAFELLRSLTLDLALGARGWRIAATASGVTIATDQTLLTAGPALSAGLSWHLAGPLFLHLRPSLALRVQQFRLNVAPLGQVLLIEPWSVGASLGALLRFE